jgi:DNA polymerase-3 subunit delta'
MAAFEPAVVRGEPAHAYLFSGPGGVGKGTAARELAAALNCDADTRPCGECRSCRDILEPDRQHPDVELVATGSLCDETEHGAHEGSRDIRICQIRRLERVLALTPYRAPWRVAIIDSAERLNQDASNAFLKTLEEPPAATVLVLITSKEEQLLETVLSRCQKVTFGRVEREKVEQALAARGVERERSTAIAALANGRLGWALRAADSDDVLTERHAFLDSAVEMAHASPATRLAWAKGADERGPAMRERFLRELEIWESWWRDVLAMSAGTPGRPMTGIINVDRFESLEREGRLYAPADIVRFLRVLQQTREHLQLNVDAQLALEVLVLDLPAASSERQRPEGAGAGMR